MLTVMPGEVGMGNVLRRCPEVNRTVKQRFDGYGKLE